MYPRDSVCYINNRRFLVEGCIFHIPVDALVEQSEIFRGMMELPVSSDQEAEGLSDENPIRLDGVSKDDFQQLIKVLHPRFQEPDSLLSFSQWASVLKLADKYCMDKVKDHAISSMNRLPIADIDHVEKIVIARKYNIESWLVPTFNAILQRSQSFTEHDLERLGAPTLLHLVALRDRLRPQCYECHSSSSWQLGGQRERITVNFTQALRKELSKLQGATSVQDIDLLDAPRFEESRPIKNLPKRKYQMLFG